VRHKREEIPMRVRHFTHTMLLFAVAALILSTETAAQTNTASPHTVTTTKFTIDDVNISKTFCIS